MGNHMTTLKTILTAFVFTTCLVVQGQDTSGLKLVSYDTLQLSLTASKVLAYNKGSVIFLMDYGKAKELLASQAKQGLLKELAKQQLDSVEKQIAKNDTAYLHDVVFTKSGWAPFDQLLCELLNSKSCIIKDEQGGFYRKIIRMRGFVWPDKYIHWTGWRYFIPGTFRYFHKCTESES